MSKFTLIFTTVFHRILDFKAGLNVYSDPFFIAFTFPSLASQHAFLPLISFISLIYAVTTFNVHISVAISMLFSQLSSTITYCRAGTAPA
jgi:hypothetical protein